MPKSLNHTDAKVKMQVLPTNISPFIINFIKSIILYLIILSYNMFNICYVFKHEDSCKLGSWVKILYTCIYFISNIAAEIKSKVGKTLKMPKHQIFFE